MHDYPALSAFSFALVALFVKATMISLLQVTARFRTRSFSAPEDAKLVGVPLAPGEASLVQRCNNVWRNDTENVPLFLALSLVYVLLGAPLDVASKLFTAYVVLRYVHTIVYLLALQPWRALLYLGGMAVCWAIAVQILLLALLNKPA
jgi:uncharacterized MAPEG superfamily protein